MYWELAVLLNRLDVEVDPSSCYAGSNNSFNSLYHQSGGSTVMQPIPQSTYTMCNPDLPTKPDPTFRYVISYSSRLARVNIIGGSLLLVLQVNTMLH